MSQMSFQFVYFYVASMNWVMSRGVHSNEPHVRAAAHWNKLGTLTSSRVCFSYVIWKTLLWENAHFQTSGWRNWNKKTGLGHPIRCSGGSLGRGVAAVSTTLRDNSAISTWVVLTGETVKSASCRPSWERRWCSRIYALNKDVERWCDLRERRGGAVLTRL